MWIKTKKWYICNESKQYILKVKKVVWLMELITSLNLIKEVSILDKWLKVNVSTDHCMYINSKADSVFP